MARPSFLKPSSGQEESEDDDTTSHSETSTTPSSNESAEEVDDEDGDDEENGEASAPPPSQSRSSKATSFSNSLKRSLSLASSKKGKKKAKFVETLDNLLGAARSAVTISAAKKETLDGLKSKAAAKKDKSKSKSKNSKQKGSLSSKKQKAKKEGAKKGKKEEATTDGEEVNFIRVGLLCLLPYGVVEYKDSDESESDSDSDDQQSARPALCTNPMLPRHVGTQKADLMKLDAYGLIHLAGDGDNAIEVPSSGSHEQLVERIYNYFPRQLSYLIKQKHPVTFYVCTKSSQGRQHRHAVCPAHSPSGKHAAHASITSRTTWKDRQLILTTSHPIPPEILSGWMEAKLAEVKAPEYGFELMDTPEGSKRKDTTAAPLVFFDDDDDSEQFPPVLDLFNTPTPGPSKPKSQKATSLKKKGKGKEVFGKGKGRAVDSEVIEVPSGSELDFKGSDADDIENPWGAHRSYIY